MAKEGNAAPALQDVSDPPPITKVKLINGIKVPWKPSGSVQVQEIVVDGVKERLVEGQNFIWLYGPGGRRVGIPYANVKQVE